MKKNIVVTCIISLLTLSGCVTFDDPANDPYRSPDLFYSEVCKYFEEHKYCRDNDGWVVDTSNMPNQYCGYTDYNGTINSHFEKIKDFKEVKEIEKCESYFTYEFRRVESPSPKMTIYDNGYIHIIHSTYILGGNYYYSIDAELATSIHASVDETIKYYSKLKEEEEKEKETFVEASNYFNYIVDTSGEVFFSGNVSSRKATFECNQDFSDYLKDIDYGLYENDDDSDYNFQIILRDESKKRTYRYDLYNSLKRIELSYSGQDEVGRNYSSRKDYSISAEDGQKIYDYVLNYVGVTIVDLPDIA